MSAIGTYVAITFWQKYKKPIIFAIISIVLAIFMIITLLIALVSGQQQQSSMGTYGAGEVPQAVRQWEPQIQEELDEHGRGEHINLVLAITTQESGGTASLDIMQSSESLGLPPNTIQDPMTSIEVGVQYFDEVMTQAEEAGVDTNTAIQSYNMGVGYIDFVAENGGEHSVELAQQFSDQMKAQTGWNVYGDPNYVEHVQRYMGDPEGSQSGNGNVGKGTGEGQLQHPYYGQDPSSYVTTSEFGMRHHPIQALQKLHAGIDLAPNGSANLPVASAAEGVVVYKAFDPSGGNMVIIEHEGYTADNGETLHTAYMHLESPANVGQGEKVDKGQVIGNTGTTGGSTGVHLHFEIHEGRGKQVDPRNYMDF